MADDADLPLDVMVSHVSSDGPSRFWVQLCGPRASDLDKLSSEMDELYEGIQSRKKYGVTVSGRLMFVRGVHTV
jgi:hypothetical protein